MIASRSRLRKLVTAAEFDLIVGDSTVMSAGILAQVLDVPLVEMVPFPLIPPVFEQSQSVPNPVAYLPQFGTFYTLDMVRLIRIHVHLLHSMTCVRHS